MHTPPEKIYSKIESLYNQSVPSIQYKASTIKRGKLASQFFKRRALAQLWLLRNLPWRQAKPKYLLIGLRSLAEIFGQFYLWIALRIAPGSYDSDIKRQKMNASPFQPDHAFLMNAGNDMAMSAITANSQMPAEPSMTNQKEITEENITKDENITRNTLEPST